MIHVLLPLLLLAVCGGARTPPLPSGIDPRDIVLNEVFYVGGAAQDWVEIENTGEMTIDVGAWWLCSEFLYEQLENMELLFGGDYMLGPGELLVVEVGGELPPLNDEAADLGLYTTMNFEDPDAMADYLQWGTAGNPGRADVAAAAGLWRELAPGVYDFVEGAAAGESAAYCGSNGGGGILTYGIDFTNGEPSLGLDQEIPCRLFGDGFESGDTDGWDQTVS